MHRVLLDYISGIPTISYLVIMAEMFWCLSYTRHPLIIYIYNLVSFLGIVIAFLGGVVQLRIREMEVPALCCAVSGRAQIQSFYLLSSKALVLNHPALPPL